MKKFQPKYTLYLLLSFFILSCERDLPSVIEDNTRSDSDYFISLNEARSYNENNCQNISFISLNLQSTKTGKNRILIPDWDSVIILSDSLSIHYEVPLKNDDFSQTKLKRIIRNKECYNNRHTVTSRLIVKYSLKKKVYNQYVVTKIWTGDIPDLSESISGLSNNSITLIYDTNGKLLTGYENDNYKISSIFAETDSLYLSEQNYYEFEMGGELQRAATYSDTFEGRVYVCPNCYLLNPYANEYCDRCHILIIKDVNVEFEEYINKVEELLRLINLTIAEGVSRHANLRHCSAVCANQVKYDFPHFCIDINMPIAGALGNLCGLTYGFERYYITGEEAYNWCSNYPYYGEIKYFIERYGIEVAFNTAEQICATGDFTPPAALTNCPKCGSKRCNGMCECPRCHSIYCSGPDYCAPKPPDRIPCPKCNNIDCLGNCKCPKCGNSSCNGKCSDIHELCPECKKCVIPSDKYHLKYRKECTDSICSNPIQHQITYDIKQNAPNAFRVFNPESNMSLARWISLENQILGEGGDAIRILINEFETENCKLNVSIDMDDSVIKGFVACYLHTKNTIYFGDKDFNASSTGLSEELFHAFQHKFFYGNEMRSCYEVEFEHMVFECLFNIDCYTGGPQNTDDLREYDIWIRKIYDENKLDIGQYDKFFNIFVNEYSVKLSSSGNLKMRKMEALQYIFGLTITNN